jgi:hypothetical protein
MVPTTLSGIHNFDRRKFLRTSALALAAAPFVLPSSGEARSATSRTLLVRSIFAGVSVIASLSNCESRFL